MAVKQKVDRNRRKVSRAALKKPERPIASDVRRKKAPTRQTARPASPVPEGPREAKPAVQGFRADRPWPIAVISAAVGAIGWVTGCRFFSRSQQQQA